MSLIADLTALLGPAHVLTGADMAGHIRDWTGAYTAAPLAVVRPADTAEVSQVVRLAAQHGVALVPVSGRTGLVGGAMTTGGLMVSTERLNRIREIRAGARIAIVEAGVILSRLHEAADEHGLFFPLWFGARGSAMIGGVLSTNAGGSNVLRYGSTRALCLGLEVVLADGRVLNLMSELHKDNSGYDLRDLFIGAEGTLGIITAAVMKLVPRARAHATATLAARSLADALILLNRLQEATGGKVEAFEYMPDTYLQRLAEHRPDLRQPFTPIRPVTILAEIGSTAPHETSPGPDGAVPLTTMLEETLAAMLEEGALLDAEVAQNARQRRMMWECREASAEVVFIGDAVVDTDVALPVDKVATFLERMEAILPTIDPGATSLCVAHLGDGNVHYNAYPSRAETRLHDAVVEAVEDVVAGLGGSFSAEHGVGLSKRPTMARRKDPVALDVMRAIKAALDPENRMNPGKVIPDAAAGKST